MSCRSSLANLTKKSSCSRTGSFLYKDRCVKKEIDMCLWGLNLFWSLYREFLNNIFCLNFAIIIAVFESLSSLLWLLLATIDIFPGRRLTHILSTLWRTRMWDSLSNYKIENYFPLIFSTCHYKKELRHNNY